MFKRFLAFFFVFVFLLLSLTFGSYADDFLGDGLASVTDPLYPVVPINTFYVSTGQSVGGQDALDTMLFNVGGFFNNGMLNSERFTIYYNNGLRSTAIDKMIDRLSDGGQFTEIRETFIPLDTGTTTLFNNANSFSIKLSCGAMQFLYAGGSYIPMVSGRRPVIRIYDTQSLGVYTVESVSYQFTAYAGKVTSTGQEDSQISVNSSFSPVTSTYVDTIGYSDYVTLFPDSFFQYAFSVVDSFEIGDSYSSPRIFLSDVKISFTVSADSSVRGIPKAFEFSNHYSDTPYIFDSLMMIENSFEVNSGGDKVYISSIPLGRFLDNTIGPFLSTPIFGPISIGNIVGGVLGLVLLLVFLKFFAGG